MPVIALPPAVFAIIVLLVGLSFVAEFRRDGGLE
jgi:hypothetical protein